MKPSKIAFDIGAKRAWFAASNTFAPSAARTADVYVFCLHHHVERDTIDPLDLSQWTMFVLPRITLDAKLPSQSRAALSTLTRIGALRTAYSDLATAIAAAATAP